MNLKKAVKQFYLEMSLNELRSVSSVPVYGNITYNSLLYIDVISLTPGCTASYIAEKINVSKAAVTLKINELIKHGLVIKTQSTTDKRVNYLTLNNALVAEYRIYDGAQQRVLERIQNKYTEKEINTFCEILTNISKGYYEEDDEQDHKQPISKKS